MQKEYKSINKSVRKKDAMQLLTGKPVYTDDVTPSDALVVKILRSPHALSLYVFIPVCRFREYIHNVIVLCAVFSV